MCACASCGRGRLTLSKHLKELRTKRHLGLAHSKCDRRKGWIIRAQLDRFDLPLRPVLLRVQNPADAVYYLPQVYGLPAARAVRVHHGNDRRPLAAARTVPGGVREEFVAAVMMPAVCSSPSRTTRLAR